MFFRAESGFFSGELFDLLKSYGWDYLVKVNLKNPEKVLQTKTWEPIKGMKDIAIFEFTYKANGWSKPRILKAMRSVKEYVRVEYLGEKQIVPVYQYMCYSSNLNLDATQFMKFTRNVQPKNFAMRETNQNVFLIGERRRKICEAKPG